MQVLSDLSDFSNNIITSLKDAFSDVWDNKIEEKILNATFEHKEKCESKLAAESPYIRNRIELIQAERDFRHFGGSDATIKNDLLDYKKLRPKLNDIFWQEELLKNSKETKNKTKIKNALSEITAIIKPHSYKDIVRRNIQESWRKDYEKMEVEWELNQIEEYRKKVVDDFSKWLDTIRKISESMKALGLEHGLLWDLSIGSLSQQDISQLVKWAKYSK